MSFIPYGDEPRGQRRPALDRMQVVRAALLLLDEVGLDELTMRRLAGRLGVQAASLYRHVRNKDELLILLADEINREIPVTEPVGSWQDQLTAMAANTRRGLLAHRDAARLVAGTAPVGPNRFRHIEAVMRVLKSAGLSGRDVVRTAYHLNNFITEFVADEARFPPAGAQRRKAFEQMRSVFASLPSDQFPTLIELAGHLVEDDGDGLFDFGLDIWLRGIERLLKRR